MLGSFGRVRLGPLLAESPGLLGSGVAEGEYELGVHSSLLLVVFTLRTG